MTELSAENRSFYRATVFLRSLYKQGLQHIIISPGSRSTPLTMAAAAMPQLKKHVVLDERSAAFTALGLGKATHHPAALICTSGTAVANYYPAVIEARKSGVPMVLLTADRPAHLQDTGANQTINQQHIFGDFAVHFNNQISLTDDESVTKKAAQMVASAKKKKGPVHINFPFSKPLEPEAQFVKSIVNENKKLDNKPEAKHPKNAAKSFCFNDDILYEIHATERPLIIAGQLAPGTPIKHVYWLAEWLEAPLLAEHGMVDYDYAIQGFEGLLRNTQTQKQLEPDLILRFGIQPASKSLLQAITNWAPERHIHFSDNGHRSDIKNSTTDFIDWDGRYFNASKFPPKKSKTWLQQWKNVEQQYHQNLEQEISNISTLTDGHIYHHLAPIIPDDWSVFISNSFPARDHSMFGRWGTPPKFTNRGASGIDGITSTALGVTIGKEKPAILFTGDLTFLHDTNALLNAKLLNHPLVIIVINNVGGSIFRMLPIAEYKKYFTEYFETPQKADITALAKSYGISTRKINSIDDLQQFDLQNHLLQSESMLSVIECKTNADASMKLRNRLWSAAL